MKNLEALVGLTITFEREGGLVVSDVVRATDGQALILTEHSWCSAGCVRGVKLGGSWVRPVDVDYAVTHRAWCVANPEAARALGD